MIKGHRKFVVTVSLLQRSVAVQLEPEWLSVPIEHLLSPGPVQTGGRPAH